jgi:ClpP class serine protease
MALGGDEILMGPMSALGPIDAQLNFEGKQFSADALLEGMQAIKDEAAATPRLNVDERGEARRSERAGCAT